MIPASTAHQDPIETLSEVFWCRFEPVHISRGARGPSSGIRTASQLLLLPLRSLKKRKSKTGAAREKEKEV